jgi:alpha/beta superfamily hydrolase
MTEERRSDMGQKILIGLILGAFGTTVGLFVNGLTNKADGAFRVAMENRVDIRTMQAQFQAHQMVIKEDMDEIKSILKRTSPYERNYQGLK